MFSFFHVVDNSLRADQVPITSASIGGKGGNKHSILRELSSWDRDNAWVGMNCHLAKHTVENKTQEGLWSGVVRAGRPATQGRRGRPHRELGKVDTSPVNSGKNIPRGVGASAKTWKWKLGIRSEWGPIMLCSLIKIWPNWILADSDLGHEWNTRSWTRVKYNPQRFHLYLR